ncbi:hypothetical protein [Pseudarthrobacter sp. PS3-L1]|uniref:phage major capsid protein n=1 Tax=Pseudarthrobacter sp. PS3-L1 TaxID=3046207 RepID=UPI0024BA442D|nr:hypothetical protein [Pseudarthrobacter sp. PS3-L1]MDJ0321836.1 hypothetical protein [Pseudarthrobacter sp. PS3-L1]
MTILNTGDIIAKEGYRVAPSVKARVLEAAKLFNEGARGLTNAAEYRLKEAFSTSDFPVLLGKAFDIEVQSTYKAVDPEWKSLARETRLKDFRPKKIIDLNGGQDTFEDVKEGEEYKAGKLSEFEYEIGIGKTGRTYGLTFELRKNNDYSDLMDFPARLATAARNTEDAKVFGSFVTASGPNTAFFKTANGNAPTALPLTRENVETAVKAIWKRKNREGIPFRALGTKLWLVVAPTLQFEAERAVTATIPDPAGGTNPIPNPLFGKVAVKVSERLSMIDASAKADTTWYIMPDPASANPALYKATMLGEEQPDIRVKRDQGERVGGGAIPVDEGSFGDDTIHYRGRHITGGAATDPIGTYVSTGS